jgi:predicted DNA-binding protein
MSESKVKGSRKGHMLTTQNQPGKKVSLYFTNELDDRIEKMATEQKRSKSQTVRLLIEQALTVVAALQM